jgi:hypothetical protein
MRHSVAGRTGSIQYLSPHFDQESRSAGQRAAPSVTAMEITENQPTHDIGSGSPVVTVTGADGNVLGLLQDR